jgi:hypothetical protein
VLALYSLVYVEERFVGPFFAMLWLAAFSALRFPDSQKIRKFLALAISAIAATTLFFTGVGALHDLEETRRVGPVYWEGAEALTQSGLKPGDRLAVFAPEAFGEGGAYVARLDRARITVWSRDTDSEWLKNAAVTTPLTDLLRQAGVKAALLYGEPPAGSTIPWKRLGHTPYYAFLLN